MRLQGAHIIEILEQAIENVFTQDASVKVGGMIQISGLRFGYRPTNAKGHRITHIQRTLGTWNAAHDLLIATNSMLAQGGHNQQEFKQGTSIREHGTQYEMLKRAFQRGRAMRTPKGIRIECEVEGH